METTGCYANRLVARQSQRSLWRGFRQLWKVSGRYEESVGAMKVIGGQEASVIAMVVTGCYANSLVAMQSQWSLSRSYGCCGKSAVAMKTQLVLWK
jgi:hypothetical protein